MSTRNVVLTEQQAIFVGQLVETRRYQNVSEVLRDVLCLLEARVQRCEAEVADIRAGVTAGFDQIELSEWGRGQFGYRIPGGWRYRSGFGAHVVANQRASFRFCVYHGVDMVKRLRMSATEHDTTRSTRKRSDKPSFIEESRRQQFLEIGVRLFRELGYEKASLARIAREAGVSKGVVLYHFSGKADLGEAVLRQVLRSYSEFLRERIDSFESAKTKVLMIPTASLEYVKAHREDYALYVDVIGCFGGLEEKREFAAWVSQRTREMLVNLVEEGKRNGEIGSVNAAALADVIQGALDGLMELYAMDPHSVNLQAVGAVLSSMIESELSRP